MVNSDEKRRKRGAVPLSALVRRVIDPISQKRGFAAADLIAAWPDVVGSRLAEFTQPQKIVWPRGEANSERPGVLTLKVDGPRAILVQHELGQILERVNAFFGYAAVGQIRLVQAPVGGRANPAHHADTSLTPKEEERLRNSVAAVDSPELRSALDRLGRGVLKRKQA